MKWRKQVMGVFALCLELETSLGAKEHRLEAYATLVVRTIEQFLAGQDIRQFETGIQEFRRKDRFIGGFRWLGALIGVDWPFQMECRGDEMIFGVHKMMTY
jgi:hypothetical protein